MNQQLLAATEQLREYIRKHESKGDYDAIVWLVSRKRYPAFPLTQLTIQQILDWQDAIDRFQNSEAVGAYQIMEDTLRVLVGQAKIPITAVFNKDTQDKLAVQLLLNRGLASYLDGRITAERFCNNLAMEWASLPVVTDVARKVKDKTWIVRKGQSYYDGDSVGNRALTDADKFLGIVRNMKMKPTTVPAQEITPKVARPKWRRWLGL